MESFPVSHRQDPAPKAMVHQATLRPEYIGIQTAKASTGFLSPWPTRVPPLRMRQRPERGGSSATAGRELRCEFA